MTKNVFDSIYIYEEPHGFQILFPKKNTLIYYENVNIFIIIIIIG